MPNFDLFRITNLAAGNITDAWRASIEGVLTDVQQHYDGVASTNQFTPIEGRTNTFVVGDQVWAQQSPGLPLPGGLPGQAMWVVNVQGQSIRLSATQGGAVIDVTSDGRVVLSKLLADYRAVSGTDVLLAVKTNIAGELTAGQKQQLRESISMQLLTWKAENEGKL